LIILYISHDINITRSNVIYGSKDGEKQIKHTDKETK